MTRDKDSGRLWRFLAPGMLHGLHNSLFVVSSHAKLLGGGVTQVARERHAILRATEGAEGTLEVVRFATGEGKGQQTGRQAWLLVRQICDLLRVPCRDRGLKIKATHSSSDSPANVDAFQLCRALAETARELVDGLPGGYVGSLEVDLALQDRNGITITLHVVSDRDVLPFPVDLARVVAAARRAIDPAVTIERLTPMQMRLFVPAVRELGPREPALATAL